MAAAKIHWHDDYILANWTKHKDYPSLVRAYNKEYGESISKHTFMSHCRRKIKQKLYCPNEIQWHDDYILANWQNHRNWLSLNRAYNKEYDEDIGYNTFKSHCHRLGLDFHYSPEQQEWLKEMYPKHGRTITTKLFNEQFCENKSEDAVKNQCQKMGLTVTEERKKEIAIENTKRFHKIGTIIAKQHGEPYVKTEHGWKRLKNIVYGDVPKGKILVHLNGDPTDCNINNLYLISRSINARMTNNKFWSENSTITKTGILCCELEELLYSDEGDEEWE